MNILSLKSQIIIFFKILLIILYKNIYYFKIKCKIKNYKILLNIMLNVLNKKYNHVYKI